ncbi:uncharacterized protein LOC112167236 [Rosa chinensis]|uniref:uncharacterized protein LOC112167236 n=1 Tax=Rosa chinensis TaxID=74649 RepID=UPI000D090C25|nr:uncharacterized protein LOC112167236 [Rosa chinensis]
MDRPPDTMVEEKEELMVSPTGGDPFHKIAHFLKPIVPSSVFKFPNESFSSLPSHFGPRECPLEVEFPGWRIQLQEDWTAWVDRLASLHQSTWKKAGIYEAIFNSTYQIRRNTELIYGLAEKWCSETNSFIFAWGEATITLEDLMVMGGYSVLGESIFNLLENRELKEIEEKLNEVRTEINRGASRRPSASLWLKKFKNNGSELEHEAFLVMWLCRCLRASELSGFGTIEQYLPHRVAMQFGFDQDIPCVVARSNQSSDRAWNHYIKKFGNASLYVPSRFLKAYISTRYLKWWKESMLGLKKTITPKLKKSKCIGGSQMRAKPAPVHPGSAPKKAVEGSKKRKKNHDFILPSVSNPKYSEKLELLSKGRNEESFVDTMKSTRSGTEDLLNEVLIEGSKADRNLKNVIGSTARSSDMASIVDSECASNSSLNEKRVSVLKDRVSRLGFITSVLIANYSGNKLEQKLMKQAPL